MKLNIYFILRCPSFEFGLIITNEIDVTMLLFNNDVLWLLTDTRAVIVLRTITMITLWDNNILNLHHIH